MSKDTKMLPVERAGAAMALNKTNPTDEGSELRHSIVLKQFSLGVRSVNVTSDNRYLIVTFEDSATIRVVDLQKLEYLQNDYTGHAASVRLTSITRDSRAFYTASWDGAFLKFDITSGECTNRINGLARSPSCFVDPEERYLFTASYDSDYDLESKNTGRCWDLSLNKTTNLYKHTAERTRHEAMDIAFDEGEVYTASDDGHAYRWKLKGQNPSLTYFTFEGTIRKVAVSKHYFAAACTDGMVRVHDKQSGERFRYFLHGDKDIREVRISRDETRLWSASDEGVISCFNLISGDLVYCRKLHYSWIWSLCLMNDDLTLVAGGGNGSVSFLDSATGKTLAQILMLPDVKDFLISCPSDGVFPEGIFYTTNKNLVQVVLVDTKKNTREKLDQNDSRRLAYIDKHNLKNLIISRLKNNGLYNSLTELYLRNQSLIETTRKNSGPRMLKA